MNSWLNIIHTSAGCCLCQTSVPGTDMLCKDCLDDLSRNEIACQHCAQPLTDATQQSCAHCQIRPPPISRCIAAYRFDDLSRELMHQFKFDGQLALAGVFATELCRRLQLSGDRPEMLIPVPLHHSRLRDRGYNQAYELAKPVAKTLGVPINLNLARRRIKTAAQSKQAKPADRMRNLRGAFHISGQSSCKHVAIIDDVMTTGATINSLADSLLRNGVQRVDAWIACRAGTIE